MKEKYISPEKPAGGHHVPEAWQRRGEPGWKGFGV
jgi:hypothetical protein